MRLLALRRRVRAALILLALLLSLSWAGCLAPAAIDGPPAPPTSPPPTTPPPILPGPAPGWPNATLAVREVVAEAGPVAQLEATIRLQQPPPRAATLVVESNVMDVRTLAHVPVDPGTPANLTVIATADGPPGRHDAVVRLYWADAPERTLDQATVPVILWAAVRLLVNASEPYASGQNVFHLSLDVPFAPWDAESAYAVLERAASTHGFAFDAPYDETLESFYVRMINGTEEEWVVNGVVSHSWMILHGGVVAGAAADDVRPDAGDTVEFRFVRCWSTGNCEGV